MAGSNSVEAKAEAAEQKKKTTTLERFKEDNLDVFQAWKDSVRDSQQKAVKAREEAEAAMAESQRVLREQMETENELMNFQFDGTANQKHDQSKEVALLRAAVRLATATAAFTRAQNIDGQLQLQFTVAYKSDFKMWKKRKAHDVWAEIVATKNKLDDLAEEYEDLAVEDDGDDDDNVPESDISESDFRREGVWPADLWFFFEVVRAWRDLAVEDDGYDDYDYDYDYDYDDFDYDDDYDYEDDDIYVGS
ncbi:hypothetical protein KC352_g12745 [Hortaea werneckii]|nr:hypothetical protein KC352_g12745 [Hortaea werneckii]